MKILVNENLRMTRAWLTLHINLLCFTVKVLPDTYRDYNLLSPAPLLGTKYYAVNMYQWSGRRCQGDQRCVTPSRYHHSHTSPQPHPVLLPRISAVARPHLYFCVLNIVNVGWYKYEVVTLLLYSVLSSAGLSPTTASTSTLF